MFYKCSIVYTSAIKYTFCSADVVSPQTLIRGKSCAHPTRPGPCSVQFFCYTSQIRHKFVTNSPRDLGILENDLRHILAFPLPQIQLSFAAPNLPQHQHRNISKQSPARIHVIHREMVAIICIEENT